MIVVCRCNMVMFPMPQIRSQSFYVSILATTGNWDFKEQMPLGYVLLIEK